MPVENRIHAIRGLRRDLLFDDVRRADDAVPSAPGVLRAEWRLLADLTPDERARFTAMDPQPVGFYSSFGPALEWRNDEPWFNAHPTTRLRFHLLAGLHRLLTKVVIAEGAYLGPFDAHQPATDGVEIQLAARENGTTPRVLYQRLLDPLKVESDRGVQAIDVTFNAARRSRRGSAFRSARKARDTHDWISLGRVKID